MSVFIASEDAGSYFELTKAGTAAVIVCLVLLVLMTAYVTGDNKHISVRQMVFSASAIALGFILSFIKIYDPPWGGSATLCSMLFVTLIGYWYGPRIGIMAAFSYGMLQFIQGGGGYMLDPLQVCLDYFVAFAALGTSGFFWKKKNALIKGYIFAILLRGAFHSIGGYLYWMDYMPENFPQSLAVIYPIVYNYSYIIAEGILTIVIISLPPVKTALARVKVMANG